MKYREDDILEYGTESKIQGFNFMIADLNLIRYNNPKFSWLLFCKPSLFN